MKARLCALALCGALLYSLCALPASAAPLADGEEALRVVRALGILVGDERGDLALGDTVTRAQFAKMMLVASGGGTPVQAATGFSDLPRAHWASGYVRAAVERGWFVGYADGTFRPNRTITLEEGCTAALRLLGYDESALGGSFPQAQLSYAQTLGLRDGVDAVQGQALTRAQCVRLFYNLLLAPAASGAVYAQTVGLSVAGGSFDYAALLERELEGPFVYDGTLALPFAQEAAAVIRNGAPAVLGELALYDVYYYNANLLTLWAYSERASGTLSALSPSASAPTSATVAGVSYPLRAAAAYALSDAGSFSLGEQVTLLLGRDGAAVAALSPAESAGEFYGVVRSSTRVLSETGQAAVVTSVQLDCTDGVTRTFTSSSGGFSQGNLVCAAVTGEGISLRRLSERSLSGSFDEGGTRFAGYTLAADVHILETSSRGTVQTVRPARLGGARLSASDVRYWALDERGALCELVLGEVTGELWSYGLLTDVQNAPMSVTGATGRYTWLRGGQSVTAVTSGVQFSVTEGGAAFCFDNGALSEARNLASGRVTALGEGFVRIGAAKYLLADGAEVYLRSGSGYYLTALADVDLDGYTLTAYYDTGFSAGGRVRVLVAAARG